MKTDLVTQPFMITAAVEGIDEAVVQRPSNISGRRLGRSMAGRVRII